jgi:hypothetical protein
MRAVLRFAVSVSSRRSWIDCGKGIGVRSCGSAMMGFFNTHIKENQEMWV